jgi:hypothetical protein
MRRYSKDLGLFFLYIVAAFVTIALGLLGGGAWWGLYLGLVIAIVGLVGLVFWTGLRPALRARTLLRTGELAEATVVRVWDTGVPLEGGRQMGLLLEVRPADRSCFQVETTLRVPLLQTALFQPGAVLQVRYEPGDLTRVAVASLGSAQGGDIISKAVVFGGQVYACVDDMPTNARRSFEQVTTPSDKAIRSRGSDVWEEQTLIADLRRQSREPYRVRQLEELQEMLEAEVITEEEYESKKTQILDQM